MGEKREVGTEVDEYSPFRWYLRRTLQRKQWENDMTVEFLKSLWESQGGKCPYTNIMMRIPESTTKTCNSPEFASLDRIDSSKGYVKGNVEFVCQFVNLAKNRYSKQQTIEIISKIKIL